MRFSALAHELPGTTNRLYARLEELRAEDATIVDLIRADVAEAGVLFPPSFLDRVLLAAAEDSRRYRPDSRGQPVAREALAAYEGVVPDNVLLTPGTSVSYDYLLKLLCETGDAILCPEPSYPLMDYIARLEGVRITPYRLDEAQGWRIDLEHLERQITGRTRAIAVISPHNPTGMVLDGPQAAALGAIAARRDLPILVDEVFREFVFDGVQSARPSAGDAPLVFTLNGFSKMFALPGLKIGWIAVSGRPALVARSMATLEMISDTFLPVNEIAQFSVPRILDPGDEGPEFVNLYRARVASCRDTAMRLLDCGKATPPAGGFYAVVSYGRDIEEEDLALELLEESHLLTHPGYFYDIEGRHLVFSFVQAPEKLLEALPRLDARLG